MLSKDNQAKYPSFTNRRVDIEDSDGKRILMPYSALKKQFYD